MAHNNQRRSTHDNSKTRTTGKHALSSHTHAAEALGGCSRSRCACSRINRRTPNTSSPALGVAPIARDASRIAFATRTYVFCRVSRAPGTRRRCGTAGFAAAPLSSSRPTPGCRCRTSSEIGSSKPSTRLSSVAPSADWPSVPGAPPSVLACMASCCDCCLRHQVRVVWHQVRVCDAQVFCEQLPVSTTVPTTAGLEEASDTKSLRCTSGV